MTQKTPAQPSKTSLKKRILIIFFVFFNIAVIVWTAFSEFGGDKNAADFSSIKINGWLLLPALLLFIIGFGSEVYKYIYMTKKFGAQKDWRVGLRTVVLGRYYDNITPAAVGGQPFQIHYMHTHGVKNGYDAIIPIVGLVTTQLGFLLVALFAYPILGSRADATVLGLGLLGLIFYAVLPVGVIIATFFPNILSKIIAAAVKFLAKLHIVKNRQEAIEKTQKSIENYASCVKQIFRDKKSGIIVLSLSVVFHVCIASLPFFILKAFGGEIDFLACFITILAITSAVYITPTPGNAGFAEGYFYSIFSSLASGYVFWAMLFWRFFTFYVYILMGIGVYSLIAYEKKTGRYFFSDVKKTIKKFFSRIRRRSISQKSKNDTKSS